ncbi:Protein of unknown function (DUF3022) [Paraburkholderia caribensis MBA4]|uniref:DUF3022 domain-containing protein n=1 Tax=Paraburkholderia caribensis MBA4 TaxID=1323664 RepID=A0A0N7JUF9_9BURK|nr:DUF3022 domain-containing protein [Paraburkholderia caribensis]ALL66301.1 Protein of unknown function (DUF3022) [Paraburkholderia caribensis MBA4]
MDTIGLSQRIEEIELALVGAVESPKTPTVSAYQEGPSTFLMLSWVVETGRDTTLDARCVVTLKLGDAQIDRYTALETAKRRVVQDRLRDLVRQHVDVSRAQPASTDNCSIELDVDDSVFDVPDEPYDML